MSQFDVKMTALADEIKAKNTTVTGKLSINEMITAVQGIQVGSDLPDGITVQPENVLDGVFYIDATGTKQEGAMPNHGNIVAISDTVERSLPGGYYDEIVIPGNIFANLSAGEIDIATSDASKVLDSEYFITGLGTFAQGTMPDHGIVEVELTDSVQILPEGRYAEITIPAAPQSSGDSTVQFGYWTADGKFQEVDLSGDAPADSGEAVTVDAVTFKTGQATPAYGTGGIDFYECASYTPEADAYTQYTMTLSGAEKEEANGEYKRTKYVDKVDESLDEYPGYTAVWEKTDGSGVKMTETYRWGEYYYEITKMETGLYVQDGPVYRRPTDYGTIPWADFDTCLQVQLTFSPWQATEIPATTEGWSGYKMNWIEKSTSSVVGDSFTVSGCEWDKVNGEYTYSSAYNEWSHAYTDVDEIAIKYVTEPEYGDLYPGWQMYDSNSGNGLYTNTAAGPDATIEEICAGPWVIDFDGPTTIPTFTPNTTTTEVPAHWEKSETLTENLQVGCFKPKVGEIYSADTSIRVRKMFDGAVYPITSDGLVFYAPLQTDYVDMVSGKVATVTDGTFAEYNGLRCLKLDGSGYVKWPDNSDLPNGTSAASLVLLAAPIDQSDWRSYMFVGQEGEDNFNIAAKNGHFREWGGDRIQVNEWQSLIVTRDDNASGKAYLNGKLNGSGSDNGNPPMPSCVCVGGNMREGYIQKVNSYIAFAAVYDRELSADEVLEIHNTLMEDVEQ